MCEWIIWVFMWWFYADILVLVVDKTLIKTILRRCISRTYDVSIKINLESVAVYIQPGSVKNSDS